MNKAITAAAFFIFYSLFPFQQLLAEGDKPDTVHTGIYVTSIHDIDFKQKEYTITFWLWMKYKNRALDFMNNLEVPSAKSVTQSFATIDSSGEQVYILMKMQCVMKDSWRIDNFPFDRQRLRLTIENSKYDNRYLVFATDTAGDQYDKRLALRGWNIDSFTISAGNHVYETAFGDPGYSKPHSEYATFRSRVVISRDSFGLFWKMFLGMYVAFLIAYVCFYIHADGMDSRFGLSVGSLFAVIGNKYIIDSSLPESTSFTMVDTLHGLTLFFILVVISATAYSLKLVKQDRIKKAEKFDFICAQILLVLYVGLNIYFIMRAKTLG